jgi:hypothetical protein
VEQFRAEGHTIDDTTLSLTVSHMLLSRTKTVFWTRVLSMMLSALS